MIDLEGLQATLARQGLQIERLEREIVRMRRKEARRDSGQPDGEVNRQWDRKLVKTTAGNGTILEEYVMTPQEQEDLEGGVVVGGPDKDKICMVSAMQEEYIRLLCHGEPKDFSSSDTRTGRSTPEEPNGNKLREESNSEARKQLMAIRAKDDPVLAPSHYMVRVPISLRDVVVDGERRLALVECRHVVDALEVRQYHNAAKAFEYLWRAGRKDELLQDLRKAHMVLGFEIERLELNTAKNIEVSK
jgi:hypothetical protein